MRSLTLAKSGLNKIRSHLLELKSSDLEDSVKSLPPGEWCFFKVAPSETWVGFVNPLIDDKFSSVQVLKKLNEAELKSFDPEKFILHKIDVAHAHRVRIKGYEKNCRLFYGTSDGLPGLIIDQFENASIIQINTAGVDRYRDSIKAHVASLMKTDAFLLDNAKYREKEFLPVFEKTDLPELHVVENGLQYRIRPEVLQKVGFYYDHRENRLQLMSFLSRLNKVCERGIDLFSYAGAWGMSALKAGAQHVDFVDQGEFSEEVSAALSLNGFRERGSFHRSDVFKFLDAAIERGNQYDLILCDPPAFAKSATQKAQALEGYSKLHRKVFKAACPDAVVAFSSCTHYVTHEEFQKNILDAASRENRKIQLVYSGMQGFDHPVNSQANKANYIKSYFYLVE